MWDALRLKSSGTMGHMCMEDNGHNGQMINDNTEVESDAFGDTRY
jgi:hypothetical protein